MAIQRVMSKQAKTGVLLQSDSLKPYIPDTRTYSRDTLQAMLEQYRMLYVKPDAGTFGNGVIKVQKLDGGYRFQNGTRIRSYASFDGLFAGLEKSRPKRRYVAQQGIDLLKHKRRRFDLRVMVQKNPSGKWETTGIIGRLGHPSKIVTNYHSGGTITPFETLMSGHMDNAAQKAFKENLRHIGVQTAEQLATRYAGLKEIGLDVAVSTSMKPWILEVNTMPDPYIFRKLKDQSIFRRMRRYAAAYAPKRTSR
ncbi:YheC/YheD family protein [Paenibacillus sp. D9]|uniref:YheC/YheD family protein n=1 Tax=Paenibacillus TaxID=44249 RepID=UPI000A656102|nr:YheC/YheD family protein [Paenibacillus sp. D9]